MCFNTTKDVAKLNRNRIQIPLSTSAYVHVSSIIFPDYFPDICLWFAFGDLFVLLYVKG